MKNLILLTCAIALLTVTGCASPDGASGKTNSAMHSDPSTALAATGAFEGILP